MQMGPLSDPNVAAPSLNLAGFSDFTFAATDQKGIPSGFSEGQFILHINSHLSSKVSFLGEISLTARSDAGTGTPPATGFNAEVERSIIRFEHNDHFKVSFGRYHTPINYWNTTFHHGQWLQTTVSRPEMTQFGGKFIPVHFVGALVEGATPAGGLNFNYNFGVGNGRGNVISRAGDAGDNNNARAYLVQLLRPARHAFTDCRPAVPAIAIGSRRAASTTTNGLHPRMSSGQRKLRKSSPSSQMPGMKTCRSRRQSPTARLFTFKPPTGYRYWTRK
jgi:hypothetical protein